MLKNIITYLNLKLDLLNYFDLTRCLSELKGDNEGKIYPVEYISDGNYERIDFDNFDGVSYWRLRDEITSDRLTNIYKAGKRIEVTVPLRLVFSVRRSKLSTDDAYAFDRIRQTIVKQFNIDDGTLKSSLLAEKVVITSPSANGDAKEVWDSETDNTGTFEPRLDFVYGSVDVDVVVTYKGECMPTECDDIDGDILHTFNFCLPTVQSRLTETQVDCLRTWLAGSCDPVTVQVNSNTVGTPASGDTYNVTVQNSQLNAVGDNANPCTIGDSQMTVHSVNVDTVPAEQTYDFRVKDSAGANIGTSANPSIVADSTITVNGSSLGATGSVVAEGSLDITVNLDGSPSGSWNGTSWEVTSAPCDDATVNANGVLVDTVASGGTLNIDVHDTADNNVGTVVSTTEIEIADTTIRNQANDWNDTEVAEGTYTLPYLRVVDSDGSNVDTVDYKPVADGAAFTCTPASYGTRILSLLRREYCVDALCGFSFRYIDDEWVGNAVCRIRRSNDNAEQDFTADEITDGTLTTFTGANDGHVVKWYDQTGNYFELFNNTAGNQAKLVTSGVVNTDTSGNPTCITTSTFGYEIGANGGNSSRLTLFSPSGAFWAVGTKNNSTSISRCISNAGNPAVGIADTTTFQNANGTGSPIAIVNGTALANNQRTTLQSAINNVEHALFMHTCQWTASGNWRTHQGILAFQAYPIGSQISEFVLDKKDWSGAALVSLINNDLQTYYGYW